MKQEMTYLQEVSSQEVTGQRYNILQESYERIEKIEHFSQREYARDEDNQVLPATDPHVDKWCALGTLAKGCALPAVTLSFSHLNGGETLGHHEMLEKDDDYVFLTELLNATAFFLYPPYPHYNKEGNMRGTYIVSLNDGNSSQLKGWPHVIKEETHRVILSIYRKALEEMEKALDLPVINRVDSKSND